jgi:hypothetical protein
LGGLTPTLRHPSPTIRIGIPMKAKMPNAAVRPNPVAISGKPIMMGTARSMNMGAPRGRT